MAFMQLPLAVVLGEPTEADYAAVLRTRFGAGGAGADAAAIFALHSELAPADLAVVAARAASTLPGPSVVGSLDTEKIISAVRSELVSASAVAPEDVEPIDLAKFPGLESIKAELEKHVLFPLEQAEQAKHFGITAKRGVLLHGKPGTGKTTVGRWLAHRLRGKFFLVGETMMHADIIRMFAAAQAAAPAVVFIDDADIIIGGWRPIDGHRGSDIFRFLLGKMDGITSGGRKQQQKGDVVVMLTAQNVHWMADMLLRSGRIELWLKTKLPDPKQKREILNKYIVEDPSAMELLSANGALPDVRAAAQASDHFCCADLRRIVNDAKVIAAWERTAGGTAKDDGIKIADGAKFLEQAATAVRRMQDEIQENMRSMYG